MFITFLLHIFITKINIISVTKGTTITSYILYFYSPINSKLLQHVVLEGCNLRDDHGGTNFY